MYNLITTLEYRPNPVWSFCYLEYRNDMCGYFIECSQYACPTRVSIHSHVIFLFCLFVFRMVFYKFFYFKLKFEAQKKLGELNTAREELIDKYFR